MTKTPEFIKERVATIYTELRRQWLAGERGEPRGPEVYQILKAENGKRIRPLPLPRLRKVYEIIAEIRPELIKGETGEDRPWSVGTGKESGIPNVATRDLLRLWRLCLALGRTFTLREAKWAVCLRSTCTSFPRLLFFACVYAEYDRLSETIHMPLDTSTLDGYLGLSVEEMDIALETDLIHHTSDALGENWKPLVRERVVALVGLFSPGLLAEDIALGRESTEDYKSEAFKSEDFKSRNVGLSEEDDWLYAITVRYLAKGPKWGKLGLAERQRILNAVRHQVPGLKLPGARSEYPHPALIRYLSDDILVAAGYETAIEGLKDTQVNGEAKA